MTVKINADITENLNINNTLHDAAEDTIMNIRWLLEGILLPTCGVMGLIGNSYSTAELIKGFFGIESLTENHNRKQILIIRAPKSFGMFLLNSPQIQAHALSCTALCRPMR